MTRFTSIHEETRYEVIVRGIKSRAEAEAVVAATERLPGASAWLPTDNTPTEADLPPQALADPEDSTEALKAGEAVR